jgi:hypothetical protein
LGGGQFNNNKQYFILILAFFSFFVYKYYNHQRIEKILNKYKSEDDPSKGSNIIKVLLILGVPVIIGAIILIMKF